ncbi:MAG: hypothetical protein JWP22_2915 [Ramlibacter sp.]|nr:hypothetical protein [Ramlibacter sp.]
MTTHTSRLGATAGVLLALALSLASHQAFAAEYWLKTGTTTVNGVPMWGYSQCTDANFGDPSTTGTCGPVTVPGPALVVPPADVALTLHLKNTLPEPTSVVIPGQFTAMTPVWIEPATVKGEPNPLAGATYAGARPAGNLTAVVRSFTAEAAALNGTANYAWTNLKPGTYLYESGTHPQVQVQMGLYGSVAKDAAAGNVAYRQGGVDITYSSQVTLLYSEIDPALHAAVAGGTYGTTGPTSTLEYAPKYFLINGRTYPDAALDPLATIPAGRNTLLRLLNASLKTHVPTINGQYWKMIAEDGNPYAFLNYPRQQYTAFLPPGKTADVLLVPANASATANARYAIFDSRLFDTNNGASGGGMVAYLSVTPASAGAPVFDSSPVVTGRVGTPYTYPAHATDPNGDAVTYSLNGAPPAGMSIVASSGLITWTPGTAGSFPVSVRASDGALFNNQAFTVVVSAGGVPNTPPTARNDSYTAIAHPTGSGLNQVVAAPGVLANDVDAEGNALHTTPATNNGITLAANGALTVPPRAAGTVSFTYRALDTANAQSGAATVTITVIANRRPTAFPDAFQVPRCTTRVSGSTCRTGAGFYLAPQLDLVANDSDPDAQTLDADNQLPLAVARVRAQTSGTNLGNTSTVTTSSGARVTISGGTVTYVPAYNFSGNDVFQYRVKDRLGTESGTSNGTGWETVTVTVQ